MNLRVHLRYSSHFLTVPFLLTSFRSSSVIALTPDVVVQNMLYRIRQCNVISPQLKIVNLEVDGEVVGKMRQEMADKLVSPEFNQDKHNNAVFQMRQKTTVGDVSDEKVTRILTLSDELERSTSSSRTEAVMDVMKKLRDDGTIKGWRDELLPVVTNFYQEEPCFLIERAAAPHLGTIQYGVHINGYTRSTKESDGTGIKLWMARRSASKSKFPGMLDHIVAGGQPFGISPLENVVKECKEEAGISEALSRERAQAASAVSYTYNESDGQINRSVLFCYDIQLPPDFIPKPVDGEVDEFFLKNLNDVIEMMDPDYHDPIKPNCYLVIIDFLVRQGVITPETPGYLDVVRELRSGECV